MTLREWCELMDVVPCPATDNAVSIVTYKTENDAGFTDLWHLEDYIVVSRHSVVIRLVQRPADHPLNAQFNL